MKITESVGLVFTQMSFAIYLFSPRMRGEHNEEEQPRRRRVRPAPLSLRARTLADDSYCSPTNILACSSTCPPPLSSSPSCSPPLISQQEAPLSDRTYSAKSSLRKSQRRQRQEQIGPPKSPGIVRCTTVAAQRGCVSHLAISSPPPPH